MSDIAKYGALAAAGSALSTMAKNSRQDNVTRLELAAQAERDQRLHDFRMQEAGARTAAADARSDKTYTRNRADKLEDRAHQAEVATAGQEFQLNLSNAKHTRNRADAKEDRQEKRRLGALDQAAKYTREDSQGEIEHQRAMELKRVGKEGLDPVEFEGIDPLQLSDIEIKARNQAEEEASARAGWLSSDKSDFGMSKADWILLRVEQIMKSEALRLKGGGRFEPSSARVQGGALPPPNAIASLKQNSADPAMVRMFDAKYGAGAAERVLAP